MASLESCKWAVREPHQSSWQMRSLIIIYGNNCPCFLGPRWLTDESDDDCSAQQSEECERESDVELQESPEAAQSFNKVWCSCEVLLCVLPLVRSFYIRVHFPDPVWGNGAPLVSCLYFSTFVSLHLDHSHERLLGSFTASSRWIQASVRLFTSAKPSFPPQLQSGIRNTFMLAQVIVSSWMWSRLSHHEDLILFIPEWSQTVVLHSTRLSPFRQLLLLLIT